MKQFKYISQITKEELNNNIVIPCTNENGYPCILIKNSIEKKISSNYNTDNLEIKLNAVLVHDNENHYFHIITSKKNDYFAKVQFNVIFEYVFMKIESKISDNSLSNLISSIYEYFKISPDADFRNMQIGVFGELLCIKKLYESGYEEIVNKYHRDFYSKHDIEINDKVRLEIKTTSSEKRIHRFKHNQIYRDDVKVFVASSILEPSQEGCSLYDLFVEIKSLYSDPDAKFALEKLMKKCGISLENKGLTFALSKAYGDLYFFDSDSLPKINIKEPNGVTNISYDVDCSFGESLDVFEMIKLFV